MADKLKVGIIGVARHRAQGAHMPPWMGQLRRSKNAGTVIFPHGQL